MHLRFDVAGWGGTGPHWDRLRAVLRHERPDRLPITVWRHFPDFEDSAESLARVHVAFQMRFGFDLVVFTPPHAYTARPWGYRPGAQMDEYGRPVDAFRPFARSGRWPDLSIAGAVDGALGETLDAIRLTARNLPDDAPLIMTVYGPLTTAYFLRGDALADDLGMGLGLDSGLAEAVESISVSLGEFCRCALQIADGLYLISYFAGTDIASDPQQARELMDIDLALLKPFYAEEKLLMLHMHGNDILFDEALDHPVDVLHWHDRWVKPSLRDARIKSEAVLMGGINEADTIHRETAAAVSLQVEDAISQVEGRGLIVAPGGPIKVSTPVSNLRAAAAAVGDVPV